MVPSAGWVLPTRKGPKGAFWELEMFCIWSWGVVTWVYTHMGKFIKLHLKISSLYIYM